jgi:uncharacterized protein (TIGR02186 family)
LTAHRLAAAIACALLCAVVARPTLASDRIVAGLSQHNVSLTTGFVGSEIFVYGAVRNDGPVPTSTAPLDVIVAVTGPVTPVQVRQKTRQFGIWINGPGVEIDAAPSFYAVASTKAFRETVSWTDDLRHRIGLDHVIRLIDAPEGVEREEFREAVKRIRQSEGLYAALPSSITVIEDTLFETRIKLPANLVEGDYTARVFLIRDKAVSDVYVDTIEVRRAGIGRWIYTYAQEQPALYGIASILVALIAGWLASAFFRTFFPT